METRFEWLARLFRGRDLDALPSGQVRVDGPGTRTDHRQSSGERSQQQVDPGIPGLRHRSPYLSSSKDESCQRCAKTHQQKQSGENGYCADNMMSRGGPALQSLDSAIDQGNAYDQAHEKQSGARPAVSEGEK